MKTSTKMLAFHGDTSVKEKYLGRVEAHRKADEIVSGVYWEKGKGCAVGCTVHSGDHSAYETEMGIPSRLAYLEDSLFERLFKIDPKLAKAWPQRFIDAVPVGADLELVFPKFMLWLLLDPKDGVIVRAKKPETIESIKHVGALYQRWAAGDKPANPEWERARNIAYDAAAYDAAADAAAAALYRRNSFWPSYWGGGALEYQAGRKHYVLMADKLIELLKAA